MSKLFKVKQWLTLADAAQHLSIVFDEVVTEADLLRFALDGHLKLSVNFVNHAKAKCGQIVSWEDTKWKKCNPITIELTQDQEQGQKKKKPSEYLTLPKELKSLIEKLPPEERNIQQHFMVSENIDDVRFLNMNKEVETIMDVWDLPMIGGERLDIEHKYQTLIGGPAVTLQTMWGTFVQNSDEEMYQLQESFDQNEFQSGSMAELEQIKAK